jgi:hypothetical protein
MAVLQNLSRMKQHLLLNIVFSSVKLLHRFGFGEAKKHFHQKELDLSTRPRYTPRTAMLGMRVPSLAFYRVFTMITQSVRPFLLYASSRLISLLAGLTFVAASLAPLERFSPISSGHKFSSMLGPPICISTT